MVVLIYEKYRSGEAGYLLLESLITLMVLMTVIILLHPLAVEWLSYRHDKKNLVEQNRLLYENSTLMIDNNLSQGRISPIYSVKVEENKISIKETGTEVTIYESHFEYE